MPKYLKSRKKRLHKGFVVACAFSAIFLPATQSHASMKDFCARILGWVQKEEFSQAESNRALQTKLAVSNNVKPEIRTLEDLLIAFTKGFEPDLNNPDERHAFEIYRKMRFGNPNTILEPGSIKEIASLKRRYPKLEKSPFRNYEVDVPQWSYPVTDELAAFLSSQSKISDKVRTSLFQIEANAGAWKKLLGYEAPEDLNIKPRDKAHKKQLQEASRRHFEAFLDKRLPKELREEIADSKIPIGVRAQKLFEHLKGERKRLMSEGNNLAPLSQAMVDLVHTMGFHDPAIVQALKSSDGFERIQAFRKILERRDSFAIHLGFEGHFQEVLDELKISYPTGLTEETRLADILQGMEDKVAAAAQVVKNSNSSRTIRHLSLAESPFRSCLGGSDCSSRKYLSKALDPNYHYFTLTDEGGFSGGHITVVLGEAKRGGKRVKVAFIDKVQNVDNVDLSVMIEGVRQSVAEKGYILALPENLGDHSGISNKAVTRNFIGRNIDTDSEYLLSGFKPHSHKYSFKNAYSRADDGLALRAVLPRRDSGGVQIKAGEETTPWSTKDFNLAKLVEESIKLKDGTLDDKLRYIGSMQAVEMAGLKKDPDFDATLLKWLSDSETPMKLRRQVLVYEWNERNKPLPELLNHNTLRA